MNSTKNQEVKYTQDSSTNDEIDLKPIFSFLLRNKKLIGIISILVFFLTCLYSLTARKIWQGEFQIVLSSKENSRTNQIRLNPIFGDFAGLSQKNNLKTQVGILESPSVLKPIYLLAISQDRNNKNKITFQKWKKI